MVLAWQAWTSTISVVRFVPSCCSAGTAWRTTRCPGWMRYMPQMWQDMLQTACAHLCVRLIAIVNRDVEVDVGLLVFISHSAPKRFRTTEWPIYTLTRHSRPPGTPSRSFISFPSKFPGMSLHFLPLHCRFSSLHFLEDSFIRIPFPFRPCIFLQLGFSPAPSSFSCKSFDFHFVDFQSRALPIFRPLFRIASMHSIIRIIRDDAGNAGGVVQY